MTNELTTKNIIELKFPDGPRLRPSMYLGADRQMTVAYREIVDNSTTEVLKGFATTVWVTFRADGGFEVSDNGRGLPVDTNAAGKHGFDLTLATLHSGGNFANTQGKNGPGLNGVGGAVVNALSSRFSIEVFKNKKCYRLDYQKGHPGYFDDSNGVESPDNPFKSGNKIIETADKRPVAEKKIRPTGTTITWWFDRGVFTEGEEVDIDDMIDRLKYTVYIVPNLRIFVKDEVNTNEDGSPREFEFYGDGGIKEMVQIISSNEILEGTQKNRGDEFEQAGIYYLQSTGKYNTKANVQDENGNFVQRAVEREVPVELAFRWSNDFEPNVRSFVNTIQTHLGGVHEEAFQRALTDVFGAKMGSMKGIGVGKNEEKPIATDYLEGLSAVISLNVLEPQFQGQQKDKLGGADVKRGLVNAFSQMLKEFSEEPKNRPAVESIFKKAIEAMKTRKLAAEAKEVRQANKKISSSASMPAKLRDCDMTGTDESELWIAEGDSAAGGLVRARDAKYQAVVPIRGKILNVWKATPKEILDNKEIQSLIKCIGAGSGDHFDINNIRYGRIFFAADADVDGLHINTLLTTLFFKIFKPMIEEGRVFQAVTPLYEIHELVGAKKTHYAVTEQDRKKIADKLDRAGVRYKVDRNKGLGELADVTLRDYTMDPINRTVRQITIEDAEAAMAGLELTMGEDSNLRKVWMADNYNTAITSGMIDV